MADFSKEYVERQFEDPQFPWDFEIEKIGKDLYRDHVYPVICEGYGFVAIYKNKEGKIQLAFDNPKEDIGLEMVDLEDLDERYKQKSLPWQKMVGQQ